MRLPGAVRGLKNVLATFHTFKILGKAMNYNFTSVDTVSITMCATRSLFLFAKVLLFFDPQSSALLLSRKRLCGCRKILVQDLDHENTS
jgi:hypothetical protein